MFPLQVCGTESRIDENHSGFVGAFLLIPLCQRCFQGCTVARWPLILTLLILGADGQVLKKNDNMFYPVQKNEIKRLCLKSKLTDLDLVSIISMSIESLEDML